MTRITNFGRKRTYVQAGFSGADNDATLVQRNVPLDDPISNKLADPESTHAQPPPKKKRKRTPKSKRDGHGTVKKVEGDAEKDSQGEEKVKDAQEESGISKKTKKSLKKKQFTKKPQKRKFSLHLTTI